MAKNNDVFPVANKLKIVLGIVGHIIFTPILLRLLSSSSKLTNVEAIFITIIAIFMAILISAMALPYGKDGNVWLVDQSRGNLLLKSTGFLALWTLMLLFR